MGEKWYIIQDVFEKTDISKSTISDLYHDRKTRLDYNTLDKLCNLFDCKTSDILIFKKAQTEISPTK
ncbi:MAG: helix-turn-helix transcriptional regulator [Oscillospiraceae bacterium]|jgi:DNA-binding Xre family transcriptional regulator